METGISDRTSSPNRSTRRRVFGAGDGQGEYDYEVLEIARVVRVVKGGRRFSFRASVVVGNRHGKIGVGVGKSKDVQAAIKKGYDQGVKNLRPITLKGSSIPHEIKAKEGGSKIMMRPARPGTGIIAGGTIRLVAEMAGISDLVTKRMGSSNKLNTARAAVKGLSALT